ncbi:Hypothetical protein POVN_LOCUS247 [uncultured virus]|nr:Hypothetical protein POVN_LOCUS247 [uncultured virus]
MLTALPFADYDLESDTVSTPPAQLSWKTLLPTAGHGPSFFELPEQEKSASIKRSSGISADITHSDRYDTTCARYGACDVAAGPVGQRWQGGMQGGNSLRGAALGAGRQLPE